MADVHISSISGEPAIIAGALHRNRAGNWTLIAEKIELESEISGQVTIQWLDLEFRGYVLRSRLNEGFCFAVIEGGAGGLTKQLQPKMYDLQVSAGMVANEIAAESGERISPLSAAALASPLASWIRRAGSAGEQLSALADAIGAIWRVLPDGSIYIGQDSYTHLSGWDHNVPQGGWNPGFGALSVLSTEMRAAPGLSYVGTIPSLETARRIAAVCHTTGDGPRTWLYFADDRAPRTDNAAEPLREFIRETMRGTEWYPSFSARVGVQRGDGTLDVYPDDKRLPSLTGVRIRVPAPGAQLMVPPGTQVTILFENGDPRQRVAVAYGEGNPAVAAALVGDAVDLGTLLVTPGVGPLAATIASITWTPPGGGSPIVFSPATPGPFSLVGKILGPGSQYLKLT